MNNRNTSTNTRTGAVKIFEGKETIVTKSYCGTGKGKKGTVKRKNKQQYVVLSTGEVREYKSERTEDERSAAMRRKLAVLCNIIRANATSKQDLFITLTYSAEQHDIEVVQEDVERFLRRLRRNRHIEYIAVPELQRNGNWHIHIILVGEDITLSYEELAKAWGHGGVHISRVRNVEKVAKYLSSPNKELRRKDYPQNMRLYRCSSGVKRPKGEVVSGVEAAERLKGCTKIRHDVYKDRAGFWHSTAVYTKSIGNRGERE